MFGKNRSKSEAFKIRSCLIIAVLGFVAGINQLAAQSNDGIDVNTLKSELANSWSNVSDKSAEVKPQAELSPTLSAKEKLELEEKTLMNKLNVDPLRKDLTQSLTDNSAAVDEKPVAGKAEAPVPEQKLEIINEDAVQQAPQELSVAKSDEKATKTKNSAAVSQQARIAELEKKLAGRNKELEETRSRLLLAETQVERLSGIIDKMNNQKMAGFMGNSAAAPVKAVLPENVSNVQPVSNPSVKKAADESLVGVVSAQKAFLRSGPSQNDSPIMTVSMGTRLVVETRHQDWYRVITPTGGRAWISSGMLKFGPGAEPGSGSNVRIGGYEKPKS